MMDDIRWKQRFNNFIKAFQALTRAVDLSNERDLTELEQQGLIQGFEFTHELAWKLLKNYLEYEGVTDLTASKDATRSAFKLGLIDDGEAWMEMISARKKTSHTYDQEVADAIVDDILNRFYPAFAAMAKKFTELSQKSSEA